MKAENHIDRELKEALEAESKALHALTLLAGHELTNSPGGVDEVWIELRQREFGVTPTLAHIMTDQHSPHDRPKLRPGA